MRSESTIPKFMECLAIRDVDGRGPWGRGGRYVPAHERELGWVYFISAGDDGPIKVGFARDITVRMKALQIGNAQELVVVGAVPGSMWIEGRAHARLKDHRVRGEWFEREPALAELEKLQNRKVEKPEFRLIAVPETYPREAAESHFPVPRTRKEALECLG